MTRTARWAPARKSNARRSRGSRVTRSEKIVVAPSTDEAGLRTITITITIRNITITITIRI